MTRTQTGAVLLLVSATLSTPGAGAAKDAAQDDPPAVSKAKSVLDFEMKTIDGEPVKLAKYKGDVLLIVNVASRCGLTKRNYQKLEPLYLRYQDRGLRILAFPANDFGSQEPGAPTEIKSFCAKYHVTFDLFAKVHVKGEKQCPLYRFLTKHENPTIAGPVLWNFQKYLVDREGKVLAKFSPKIDPDDPQLVAALEKALGPAGKSN